MTNTLTIPHNFTPRSYQLDLFKALDGGQKRAFLRWPRRHGKDKACWAYLIKEACRVPGNYFYIFPLLTDAKRALWENVDADGFRTLDHLPREMYKRRSNQELVIELNNGSFIRLLGMDEPDKIRGIAARGAVFSEFAYQPSDGYKIIMPALRETGGWCIFNSTPNGRNHFYEMDMRVKNAPKWYYSSFQCLWPDEPNYEGRYIALDDLHEVQHEEGFTEEEMAQEYGVSYSAGMKGAFYATHIEKARAEHRIGNFPVSDHLWTDTFWDLGMSDSTAIWFRQTDGSRVVWVDYHEDTGKDIAHYVKILEQKGYNYRTHFLPHDGGHRTIQTQFRTNEIFRMCCKEAKISDDVVVVPKVGIQDGINGIRKRFSSYFFNEGLTADGIQKLELYHRRYNPKTQSYVKDPVHDWTSHCADALRTEASAEQYDIFQDEKFLEVNNIRVISDFSVFDE